MRNPSIPLEGRRILIVEDRYLIATEMADEVRRMGGEVLGPSPSVERARELIGEEQVDIALLDVNLDGELVFPLADMLQSRGVPFLFLTGYDEAVLPEAWRDRPRISKPVDPRELRAHLVATAREIS